MIFTRRFGALRARPVFQSVTQWDNELEYYGDVRFLDKPAENETETEESVA